MAEIRLSGKSGSGLVARVDDADAETLSAFRWYALRVSGSKTVYARTTIHGRTEFLHRMVMGATTGEEVDHIDGDGLNNHRANLRFVTHQENLKAAARLPGRYGNLTTEELDAELERWSAGT